MTSTNKHKKKLIEVAIPLEAINAASAREKSIRHGHPSTLHLWWARRPLAACRAVLFAQLVDDPSGYADTLLEDPKICKQAEADLVVRLKLWRNRKADAQGNVPDTPEPTLEDCAADIERKRLFQIIEELVLWENSTNEEVLERARAEIRRSCGGVLPPVYDPFSGGGSIPLEAQRLGLPAYGSDLNPVAVMIGKAMIEIPPKFKDMPPIHPGIKERSFYRNAEGLAEDVKYYGEWMREKAWERVGQLYPQVDLPKEYGGGKATVIAWIWARTVPSPDPAFSDVQVPLVSNFMLSSKKDNSAWIQPILDRANKDIEYKIRTSGTEKEIEKASLGTSAGKRQAFRCVISDAAIPYDYIREAGKQGRMGIELLAVVAEGRVGRVYLAPSEVQVSIAKSASPAWSPTTPLPDNPRDFKTPNYGLTSFGDLFTARQLCAINAFCEAAIEAKEYLVHHARSAGLTEAGDGLDAGGNGATAYAEAISLYLAFSVSKALTRNCALAIWEPGMGRLAGALGRQAFPMQWSFAETNPFAGAGGDISGTAKSVSEVLDQLVLPNPGRIRQSNAAEITNDRSVVFCTDPPYYDNIIYADLSDFFYIWLRRTAGHIFPSMLSTLVTPKAEEMVVAPNRHSSKAVADAFFSNEIEKAFKAMSGQMDVGFPSTIFYAFKQSDIEEGGVSSAGWATFLEGVLRSGLSVSATWPVRTEATNALKKGMNALANSVVLVCRKKEATAEVIARAEFIRALKRELPPAIAELQAANIAPADMPQSAIGPGMGVFSRYKAVLESDDSPMSVKTALQLINRELDEYLGGIQGEFDADTRFAISWFEQHGMSKGEYGSADNLARARGISVESVKHAGIIESAAGKVRILARDELDDDWEPKGDGHLTVWECLQHLVRKYEKDGISHDTAVLLKKIDAKAEAVKDLAYCLYDISANKRKDAKEATAYNALIADWTELTRQAAAIHDTSGDRQIPLNI
jgi:putative DNA methylase